MAAPFYGMIEEVHVMLVDNDEEFVTKMVDSLKSYHYKVTTVDMTSTAMSMLSKGKQKVDMMILNVHSSNLLSFDLLAQAMTLDIISLVVYDELNELVTKKALDEGAYLCVKKPFDEEIVKYLWQFVLRKNIQTEKAREGSGKSRDHMNIDDIRNNNIVGENEEQLREKKNVCDIEERCHNIRDTEDDVVLNGKYKLRRKRGRKSMKEINEGEGQSKAINKVVMQKNFIEWTDDLHAKFMEAVQQLGEGRCYPKDILEVMNVPGLTKMQIASHLQKCRRNNWRSPKERKSIHHPSGRGSSSGSHETRSSFRKFGIMPRLQTNVPNLQCNLDRIQRGSELPFPTINTNNIFARGESLIQQQLYRSQLQVQPHYLSIGNPFNNPFLSAQNNVGSGLQQQHGPLFGMLDSQGLHGPIIGKTNYRPGLTLNNGDHHTHSDYNLDLNVAQGATYSGSRIPNIGNATIDDYNLNVNVDNMTTYSSSAMMSDIYVGNATINRLRASNANFQQYVGEPNLSDPSNIVAPSYVDFSNVAYLFQNLGPPSANLPNEQGREFDQVYPDDQVARIENYSDESSI